MRVIHFDLAYTQGLAGGDKCTLETIKHLGSEGVDNLVLTTVNGRITYERLGLKETSHVRYHTVPDYPIDGGMGLLIAYARRAVAACHLIDALDLCDDDILFCHNEFLPNAIPHRRAAMRYPRTAAVYWVHMLAPALFKGYMKHFGRGYSFPSARLLHYWLTQKLYFAGVVRRGVMLTNNPYYERLLRRRFASHRIHVLARYAGADVPDFRIAAKDYDVAWLGRIHAQKGVLDLPDVAARVRGAVPGAKMLVIGDGEQALRRKLVGKIRRLGLDHAVALKGAIIDDEKYRLLQRAKVFIMPSRYESFGQVILEAMKCGLPVVAYDLPVYSVFNAGIIRVPFSNVDAMAREVVRLLVDDVWCKTCSQRAKAAATGFSWHQTAAEIHGLLTSLTP